MAKYKTKPIVVDAVQWFKMGDHPAVYKPTPNSLPLIKTPEGLFFVTPGDWVITGESGWHCLCKPEVFSLSYDLI